MYLLHQRCERIFRNLGGQCELEPEVLVQLVPVFVTAPDGEGDILCIPRWE